VDSYVDWSAVGQTLGYSLGAVLVVVGAFSVGALALARADGLRAAARPAATLTAGAFACFAVALAGVGLGIWFIIDK
jgi:hypothetical protein